MSLTIGIPNDVNEPLPDQRRVAKMQANRNYIMSLCNRAYKLLSNANLVSLNILSQIDHNNKSNNSQGPMRPKINFTNEIKRNFFTD